jgi:hypothetical protein
MSAERAEAPLENVVEPTFPTHRKAAIVLKPSEELFDLPPAAVAAAPVLPAILPIGTVWGNYLGAPLRQCQIQAVRIMDVAANQVF